MGRDKQKYTVVGQSEDEAEDEANGSVYEVDQNGDRAAGLPPSPQPGGEDGGDIEAALAPSSGGGHRYSCKCGAMCGCGGSAVLVGLVGLLLQTPAGRIALCGRSTCDTPACVHLASQLLSTMNPAVDPCDDFYEYTCGGWERARSEGVQAPHGLLSPTVSAASLLLSPQTVGAVAARSTVEVLRQRTTHELFRLLETARTAPPPPPGAPAMSLAAGFYAACMDEEGVEAQQGVPLAQLLSSEELVPHLTGSWSDERSGDDHGLDARGYSKWARSLGFLDGRLDSPAFLALSVELDPHTGNASAFVEQAVLTLGASAVPVYHQPRAAGDGGDGSAAAGGGGAPRNASSDPLLRALRRLMVRPTLCQMCTPSAHSTQRADRRAGRDWAWLSGAASPLTLALTLAPPGALDAPHGGPRRAGGG
eukprot:COSAG01_NODE_6464_length_3651_cov_12.508441_2_plen_421_part_00